MKIKRYDRTGCDDLSGIFVKHADYAAIEARCAALATENSALKQFPEQIIGFVGRLGTSEIGSSTREAIESAAKRIKTPATDAFLAEVRAQGADAVADQHRRKYEELKPINVFFANEHMGAQEVAEFVAAQLRQDANTANLVAAGIITKVGE